MAKGDVHTVPHGASWANEYEGDPGPTNIHDTQEKAVQEGRELARQREVEHLIHNQDGSVGERNNYGNDPRSRPA